MRLTHVGREQAAAQQAVAQNQAVTGGEIAQRSEEIDRAVNQAREVSEGPETVSEEGGSAGERERRSTARREGGTDEEPDDEAFHDPDLGRNIDLSG